MMVMTAKVDMKKILLVLTAIAAVILALLMLLDRETPAAAQTAATFVSGNDARVKYLTDLGWDVTTSPVESGQVRIPEESSEVFDRYNLLQKSQGFDLHTYAGKKVMRYVYRINNYPGATDPVYATLLIHKDTVIGGDITDTSAGGRIHGLKMPVRNGASATQPETVPQPAA